MKKISILLALCVLFASFLPSCRKVSGSGPIVSETRKISGFNEIRSELSADVYISSGSNYNIVIEGQQNIIDAIETVLSNGMLTVRVKNNTIIKPDERIKVYITSPDVRSIVLSGSGNIVTTDTLQTSELRLKINGSGSIIMQALAAYSVDANISGSGEININGGAVTHEDIDISGSGSINFLNLQASNSKIRIAGSGNATVFVAEYLQVRISGSGSVFYKGEPAVDVQITGSGKLKKI